MALIITFQNDGTGVLEGTPGGVGNYDVAVYINSEKIYDCRIEDHKRADGWEGLVGRLAAETMDDLRDECIKLRERIRQGHIAVGEADYAMVAGNTANEPVPPSTILGWLHYIASALRGPLEDQI